MHAQATVAWPDAVRTALCIGKGHGNVTCTWQLACEGLYHSAILFTAWINAKSFFFSLNLIRFIADFPCNRLVKSTFPCFSVWKYVFRFQGLIPCFPSVSAIAENHRPYLYKSPKYCDLQLYLFGGVIFIREIIFFSEIHGFSHFLEPLLILVTSVSELGSIRYQWFDSGFHLTLCLAFCHLMIVIVVTSWPARPSCTQT